MIKRAAYFVIFSSFIAVPTMIFYALFAGLIGGWPTGHIAGGGWVVAFTFGVITGVKLWDMVIPPIDEIPTVVIVPYWVEFLYNLRWKFLSSLLSLAFYLITDSGVGGALCGVVLALGLTFYVEVIIDHRHDNAGYGPVIA